MGYSAMAGGKNLARGVALMLTSSLMTCVGQLLWKLSADGSLPLLLGGFALYGAGALTMIFALRCGELSVLHPMLGAGYVLSFVLGRIFLREAITVGKVIGLTCIVFGLFFIVRSGVKES